MTFKMMNKTMYPTTALWPNQEPTKRSSEERMQFALSVIEDALNLLSESEDLPQGGSLLSPA
jgi:hypothetical protein